MPITQAQIQDVGGDRVLLRGIQGHLKPETLKVNLCIDGGWLAEAEISYAGFNANERAQLAAQIICERLGNLSLRIDLIGSTSVFASDSGESPQIKSTHDFEDIRLRVATAHQDRNQALRVCREVTALYTCGPAGGGGVRTSLKPRLNTLVCFIPRDRVHASYEFFQG